jgi:hypothetical protein
MCRCLPGEMFIHRSKKVKHLRALFLMVLIALPMSIHAHHFKGLPHFSYFENYPQIPTEEFLGQGGPYELSLVLYDFQGIKRTDALQPDDARFYLIVYNLIENRTYNGAVTLDIMDRDRVVYTEEMASSHEESLYSMQTILPDDGKYSLRVTLRESDDLEIDIPFLLTSQRVHWGKWLIWTMVGLISVVAVGSRKARIVQDQKNNAKQARAARERRQDG